ncbi:hypothetical protein [Dietzia cercidiphylli]|uniref:Helix-turn-helix domain-containing protein n=1 Tax=Dietzia cercidiphylli TaxID=498199 RepID=A0ABN2IPX1_9ACTN|nr:hypothetical protein [Dietzia cercidiphylli]MBB1047754.1 hypothetical protein [Dietzia cercidiphylli]
MTGSAGPAPARVRELAEQGYGRNACARELGISRRAVDAAAVEAGVEWSREHTRQATAALVADSQHELSAMFSETASLAARRLLVELQSESPDPALIRALSSAADLPAGKLLIIADRVSTTDHDDRGDSLLDTLASGFASWAEHVANTTDHDDHDRPITIEGNTR